MILRTPCPCSLPGGRVANGGRRSCLQRAPDVSLGGHGGTMRTTLSDESGKASLPEITGYTLLRAIGHGGMSTVYLGEQVSLSRQVAIKVMLPEALADEVS